MPKADDAPWLPGSAYRPLTESAPDRPARPARAHWHSYWIGPRDGERRRRSAATAATAATSQRDGVTAPPAEERVPRRRRRKRSGSG